MKFNYLMLCMALCSNTVYALEFVSNISPMSKSIHQERIQNGAYKVSCPLQVSRLTEVTFSYYDFAGNIHDDGSLVVMDAIAENVASIMRDLYKIKFPINKRTMGAFPAQQGQ